MAIKGYKGPILVLTLAVLLLVLSSCCDCCSSKKEAIVKKPETTESKLFYILSISNVLCTKLIDNCANNTACHVLILQVKRCQLSHLWSVPKLEKLTTTTAIKLIFLPLSLPII